jgi:putative FmdB family regulatory protein
MAMPIYEFYCRKCDTVYSFFSRSANTQKVPFCPRCQTVRLKRQVSLFARISGKNQGGGFEEGALPPLDEAKMEQAMAMLARESEKIKVDDPRQAALLMRKLTATAGLNMGQGMEEALSRLEKGEDPDKIEAEMEDVFAAEEPFMSADKPARGRRTTIQPRIDETLYDL